MIEERVRARDLGFLEERALTDFVRRQRWFGSKAHEITHARTVDAAVLRTEPPLMVSALVEIRFREGTHELYQVLLGFRPSNDDWDGETIAESDGWRIYDALVDPTLARELFHLMREQGSHEGEEGRLESRTIDTGLIVAEFAEPRPVGSEQSNTSIVFGDLLILKVYRRIEPGINPELELLRFLTERGFANTAPLAGWYSYTGRVLDVTLGILQRYVPDGIDGWQLALDELARDPEAFLARARRLGEVTGDLHSALASDSLNADFAPEEASPESIPLLAATIDHEIESIFLELPKTDAVAPIADRGEELRDRLRNIYVSGVGKIIRHHGDYHLGQVLWSGADWIVLDFEGEPARSLSERRRKRSPLRDVAGMLRSFANAAAAARINQGVDVPEDWEQRACDTFLEGYYERVDRKLLPLGRDNTEKLLAVFELEKAVYELRYELNSRPDWVPIPVSGIVKLLDAPW
ncbi:MAG TPA: phosphotransferase [Gaiellaceae bacterium]|nr:phosphotransferase [Gaiellaceae bacterium]